MATPSSGPISIDNVRSEFLIPTGAISLSSLYKNGPYIGSNNANVPSSGTISFSHFYGLTREFQLNVTITGETTKNYSLRDAAIAAGWNQTGKMTAYITVNGVLGSTSTSTAAFTDVGSYPAGSFYVVTVNAGGYIVGAGGRGGYGEDNPMGSAYWAKSGGPAMWLSGTGITKTFINNGVIGGGGAGGWGGYHCSTGGAGGGGAGSTPGLGGRNAPQGNGEVGNSGTLTQGGAGISGNCDEQQGGNGHGLGQGQYSALGGIGSSGWGSVSSYSGSGVRYGTFS